MNAIATRDQWILVFFAAALGVTNVSVMLSDDAWVLPRDDTLFGIQLIAWIAGFALAAAMLLRDLVEGTQEYFAHRPVPRRRLFDGVWIAGGLCLVIGTIVPVLFAALIGPILRPHPAADLSYVWMYFGTATVGLAMFGAVAFSLTLPANWAWRGGSALVLGFAVVITASVLSKAPVPGAGASLGLYVAVMLGLAVVFLAAARHQVVRAPDADRPLTIAGVAALGLGVLATVGLVTLGLAGVQEGIAYQYDLPDLAVERDGTVTAHRKWRRETDTVWRKYDQWHESHRANDVRPGRFDDVDFIARSDRFEDAGHEEQTYLHGTTRRVRIHQPYWQREGELRVLGRAPDGAAFSSDAQATRLDGQRSLIVFEPKRNELWRWARGSKSTLFEPLRLPDGDRPVALARRNDPESSGSIRVVEGERGVYVIQNGSVLELGPAFAKPDRPTFEAKTTGFDPIEPRVSITRTDGAVIFDEVLEGGSAIPVALFAISALRPPLLTLASTAAPARSTFVGLDPLDATAFVDPLVAGGKRWWFVAAHGLFGAVLAWLASRRLGRLGASTRRRFAWSLLVFAGGIFAFTMLRWVELPRAYRTAPDGTEPAAPARLLLHSA